MMYYPRLLETKLQRLANQFKTVLVVGARQVGKSTILSHCFPSHQHITFDALTDDFAAKADPVRFLNNFPPPIILDEIQYCQDLLSPLKRYVDQLDKNGQYLLTGSQNLSALKHAAESMAGRVGIMQLDPLSFDEIAQTPQYFLTHLLTTPEQLQTKFSGLLPLPYTLYEMIWRGGMPDLLGRDTVDIPDYFLSYTKTYIERDVRLLENIRDLSQFERLVRLLSALVAQEINPTQLGRELGITRATAQKWLEILKHTYQWHEIEPYYGNITKRITKKTKGYLCDSGMACFYHRISSPRALGAHPLLGALFENFIVMNILRLANTLSVPPNVYHWRTHAGAEIDLLLERDGQLFPIEIKCKSQLNKHDTRSLQAFFNSYQHKNIPIGIILYAGNECFEITDNIIAIPWNAQFNA